MNTNSRADTVEQYVSLAKLLGVATMLLCLLMVLIQAVSEGSDIEDVKRIGGFAGLMVKVFAGLGLAGVIGLLWAASNSSRSDSEAR